LKSFSDFSEKFSDFFNCLMMAEVIVFGAKSDFFSKEKKVN